MIQYLVGLLILKVWSLGIWGWNKVLIMLKNKVIEDNSKCKKKIREYDIVLLLLLYMQYYKGIVLVGVY